MRLSPAEFDSAWDQTMSSYCSTPKWLSPLAKRHNRIFNSACKTHDRCYSAASRTDRRTCDARFKRDMRALCVKKYNNKTQHRLRESCLDASTSYYTGVRIFGGPGIKGRVRTTDGNPTYDESSCPACDHDCDFHLFGSSYGWSPDRRGFLAQLRICGGPDVPATGDSVTHHRSRRGFLPTAANAGAFRTLMLSALA